MREAMNDFEPFSVNKTRRCWMSMCSPAQFLLLWVGDWPQAMRSELPAAPQPLQVLHVSEQEEDIFAFRMGLKQPVMKTAHAAICEPLRDAHEWIPPPKQAHPWVPHQRWHKKYCRVDSHTECIHSAECECAAHHHCDELGFSPPHTLNRDLIVPFWSYSVYSYHHCPLLWFLHLTAAISNKPGWICGIFLATRSSDELPYQEPGRNLSRMEPQPLLEFSFFSDLTSTSFLK